MASIVLSAAGSALGSGIGGALGASVGKLAGSFAGRFIEQKLFASESTIYSASKRLSEISMQTSAWGEMIPILYGIQHIAGNIIWASEVREVANKSTHTTGSKFGKAKHIHTEYSYMVSVAIALCEGVITSVNRIWANGREINMGSYNIRIYKGDELQLPDPAIEAELGVHNAPAYRGLAYVVFEDLDLAEFGNHLPNFNFEVVRNVLAGSENVENMVEAITIIPGSGEFVYDTKEQFKFKADDSEQGPLQRGYKKSINRHTRNEITDSLLSLRQLKDALPNIKWTAPVVSWFVTDVDLAKANVLPGVEFVSGASTSPDQWKVRSFDRQNAHPITWKDGKAIYGGTPSDQSVKRYLAALKKQGYNIMFYPMLFVDAAAKPWRGRLSADAEVLTDFFLKPGGYNDFILHYANLVKGKVDAFLIGSELKGMTKVKDDAGNYVVVKLLVELAKKVKKVLGKGVKISYAADWSEYHHDDLGYYHLDELWGSEYIDFVGVDAYFPLTNSKTSVYDVDKLIEAWESGEGIDFFYTDEMKHEKKPLSPQYAWKNLEWWWSNEHINPDGVKTKWVPKSKQIWFTEFGYPSVDCASNQPNVFFDESSSESAFPIHSKQSTDFFAQRAAIHATLKKWQNSEMVAQKFLWTWDARPYPYWPGLKNVWSDYKNWEKGHWVQGKLGISVLAAVIYELCEKAGIAREKINAFGLKDYLEGMCINSQTSVKRVIDLLRKAYDFDVMEAEAQLNFIKRENGKALRVVDAENLVHVKNQPVMAINRSNEFDLPYEVNLNFFDRSKDLRINTASACYIQSEGQHSVSYNFPIVFSELKAKQVAHNMLLEAWNSQNTYTFKLPSKYISLKPADLLLLKMQERELLLRVVSIQIIENRVVAVKAVEEHPQVKYFFKDADVAIDFEEIDNVIGTHVEVLDIPLLPNESDKARVLVAATKLGKKWEGAYIEVKSGSAVASCYAYQSATVGFALNKLEPNNPWLIDKENKLLVNLLDGKLESVSLDDLLNYKNLAVVGEEVIQFRYAKLIGESQYELSYLVRGRFGTEMKVGEHKASDRFVLLDEKLISLDIPIRFANTKLEAKAFSLGGGGELESEFAYEVNSQKPYSLCHIRKHGDNISFIRRTRLGGEWSSYKDVDLAEEKELYLLSFAGKEQVLSDNSFHSPNADFSIAQLGKIMGKVNSITEPL